MKNDKHIWESEVRQRVLDHEFGYEQEGWGEMVDLLDGINSSVSDAAPGPSSDIGLSGYWKVGFASLLLMGAIAWWYWPASSSLETSSPFSIESTAVPTPIKENATKSFGSGKGLEEIPAQKRVEIWEAQPSVILTNENTEGIEVPVEKVEEDILALPAARKKIPLLPALPNRKALHLFDTPLESIDLDLPALPSPLTPKRKRNRKKLYPDVIPNY